MEITRPKIVISALELLLVIPDAAQRRSGIQCLCFPVCKRLDAA